MKRVVVVPEGHTEVGGDLGDINGLIEVHNVLSLWVHLHEDLVLAHELDDLTDVGSWLVQQLKLLPQHADYLRVRRLSQDTKKWRKMSGKKPLELSSFLWASSLRRFRTFSFLTASSSSILCL